eukprot:335701_1
MSERSKSKSRGKTRGESRGKSKQKSSGQSNKKSKDKSNAVTNWRQSLDWREIFKLKGTNPPQILLLKCVLIRFTNKPSFTVYSTPSTVAHTKIKSMENLVKCIREKVKPKFLKEIEAEYQSQLTYEHFKKNAAKKDKFKDALKNSQFINRTKLTIEKLLEEIKTVGLGKLDADTNTNF